MPSAGMLRPFPARCRAVADAFSFSPNRHNAPDTGPIRSLLTVRDLRQKVRIMSGLERRPARRHQGCRPFALGRSDRPRRARPRAAPSAVAHREQRAPAAYQYPRTPGRASCPPGAPRSRQVRGRVPDIRAAGARPRRPPHQLHRGHGPARARAGPRARAVRQASSSRLVGRRMVLADATRRSPA